MKRLLLAALAVLLLSVPGMSVADGPGMSVADGPATADLLGRLDQLEAESRYLRAELERMRAQVVPLPAVEEGTPAVEASMTRYLDPPPADVDYYTLPELRAEMKKLAWTKGDFRIVPYGYLWGSMIYMTERTFPEAYTLFVPSASNEGEDVFVIDTRRTRVGLDIFGPKVCLPLFGWLESSGRVEIDMHGAFATENKPGVLFRHAYGDLKNERWRILAGQTWDVISPLYPGTISYSVGWGGGNIGYRRAQVRLERYLAVSNRLLITTQGSLNQNIVSDLPSAQRESSGWPVIEGRMGFTVGPRGKNCKPAVFGVSSHIGNQGFDFAGPAPPAQDDARRRTWSVNLDMKVPITDRFGVQGELFTGENLGAFLGGALQGIDDTSGEPIRTSGGWVDVWFDWTPRWHSHVGYGVDNPVDRDVVGGRTYNQFFFGNISYDVTKKLNLGFEVASWKTLYKDPALKPGESVIFEFAGRYGF